MHKPKHTILVVLLALAGLLALPMQLNAAGTSVYLSPIMAGRPSCVNLPVPTGGRAATATSKNPKLCTPTPTNTPTQLSTNTPTFVAFPGIVSVTPWLTLKTPLYRLCSGMPGRLYET